MKIEFLISEKKFTYIKTVAEIIHGKKIKLDLYHRNTKINSRLIKELKFKKWKYRRARR